MFKRASWVILATSLFAVLLGVVGCGGGGAAAHGQLLADLRQAINAEVTTADTSAEHSRLVEQVADADALQGKTRVEVQEAIGRGEECSVHPRCQEHGFSAHDWFYAVGRSSSGAVRNLPLLIVGFDRTGRVDRIWNFRTH